MYQELYDRSKERRMVLPILKNITMTDLIMKNAPGKGKRKSIAHRDDHDNDRRPDRHPLWDLMRLSFHPTACRTERLGVRELPLMLFMGCSAGTRDQSIVTHLRYRFVGSMVERWLYWSSLPRCSFCSRRSERGVVTLEASPSGR